jgi:4'-phosphopantetheinyl transferase EntD
MSSSAEAPSLGSVRTMVQLLPAAVACAEIERDDPLASPFPEGIAQVEGAIERRLSEFATSGTCVRRALRELGLPEAAILWGPDREPQWPLGIVVPCSIAATRARSRTASHSLQRRQPTL